MAGKGGLGEPSFLDTPTYVTSIFLALFLLASIAFERSTHFLVHYFQKRKRNGLATAVQNLVTELSLVGFISLLLIVLEAPISSICVSYDPGSYETWGLLSNVAGCDCCLANTKSVGTCFAIDRACGTDPAFCNCGGQDPSCLLGPAPLADVLDQYRYNNTCAELVDGIAASPEAEAAKKEKKAKCDGMVPEESGGCGKGKAPLVSVTAMHEIHLFIFYAAVSHVILASIMVVLASWRVRRWRRTCADEEDEHVQRVRGILDQQRAAQAAPATRWQKMKAGLHRSVSAMSGRSRGPSLPSSPTAAAAAAAEHAERGSARPSLELTRPASPPPAAAVPAAAAAAAAPGSAGDSSPDAKGLSDSGSSSPVPPEPPLGAAAPAAAAAAAAAEAAKGVSAVAAQVDEGAALPAIDEAALDLERSQSEEQRREILSKRSQFFKRQATLKRGDHRGQLKELAILLLHQFNPRPIAADDVRVMRASFILTHRVPPGFDFWDYVADSMEDDFSRVVGIGGEMWVTLGIFILISGPLGWAAIIFICLAALVLLIVNTKIFSITRHVCRGAKANVLEKGYFWFGKPSLMLIPIRFLLFLCSLMFSSIVFFALTYGGKSCPFTSAGNRFWLSWSAPWWLGLVASAVIFLDASLRTLPCYSLAVQMGSDFKHHMLPKGVREKLLHIAQAVKAKHKALEAEAAARDGSRRGGMLGGLSRKQAMDHPHAQ